MLIGFPVTADFGEDIPRRTFAGGESAKACWLLTMSTTLRSDDGKDFLVRRTGCAETGLPVERCAMTQIFMKNIQLIKRLLDVNDGEVLESKTWIFTFSALNV
jgi:hypothetical protein